MRTAVREHRTPLSGDTTAAALAAALGSEPADRPSALAVAPSRGQTRPIRVVLADDHAPTRAWLRTALSAERGISVVAEAESGLDLLDMLPGVTRDVVLLDLVMPRGDGMHVLEALAGKPDRPAIVILSAHDDAGHVDRALALGADGYVIKSAPLHEIVAAVTHSVAGGVYIQPMIAGGVVQRHLLMAGPAELTASNLSRRQLELLRALAIGMTNKEIAHLLNLSPGTVNDYMKDLFMRLGVASRAAAVSTGMRRRLIQ